MMMEVVRMLLEVGNYGDQQTQQRAKQRRSGPSFNVSDSASLNEYFNAVFNSIMVFVAFGRWTHADHDDHNDHDNRYYGNYVEYEDHDYGHDDDRQLVTVLLW